MSWKRGGPDLPPRHAEDDGDDEVDEVEDRVQVHECLQGDEEDGAFPCDEDAENQEHDGEFGEGDGGAVEDILVVGVLRGGCLWSAAIRRVSLSRPDAS